MVTLDGKFLSSFLNEELKSRVSKFEQKHSFPPGLAVVLVGEDSASQIYVRQKMRKCSEVGIRSILKRFPSSIKDCDLKKEIQDLNKDPKIHGVLVQLPLPDPLKTNQVLSWLKPEKDPDGLTLENKGLLWSHTPRVIPCTPLGIIKLLKYYKIPIEKQKVVVIGRSQIVGMPMVQQFVFHNATVTLCHSQTQNLQQECLKADIVVCCAGKRGLLNKDYFKKSAVVVDVGIHRVDQGDKVLIEGDVQKQGLEDHLKALTPVPGGVGPMTIAMLLENTFRLAKLSVSYES